MFLYGSLERALRRPFSFAPLRRTALFVLLAVALCACAGRAPEPDVRRANAADLAAAADLEVRRIETGALTLRAFARGSGRELVVYIEGDGFAWRSRRRPSADPTPIDPFALRLAARDASEAVAYLARPCQYLGGPQCRDDALWTSARFSATAVEATNAAIDALKRDAGADRVRLVGYSGGAAIAALVAARRDDVASLTTVAGYLDPTRLNAERGVSPLSGSLDPVRDAAPALRGLPQRHYAGARDDVIPSWSIASFVDAVADPLCARMVAVEAATHREGWVENWSAAALAPASCQDG